MCDVQYYCTLPTSWQMRRQYLGLVEAHNKEMLEVRNSVRDYLG